MKSFNLLFFVLGFLFILSSCSDDDSQDPKVEEQDAPQIGIFGTEDGLPPVRVPQAMAESSDPHAIMATAYVSISTSFSIYSVFFEVPEGAKSSGQPITAANGRVSADYKTYEWTGADGSAIAYQFSEQGGKQLFEIFIKEGGKGYLKMMEVLQDKDGKSGSMKWFSELGMSALWTWKIMPDESYHLVFSSDDSRYEVNSNKDLSGTVKFYDGNALVSEISWDSKGNGVWTDYNDEGEIEDQGDWEV